MMLNKIYRSPLEGATAVAEAPAMDAAESNVETQAAPETASEAAPKPKAEVLTDWQAYQKMQEKEARNPNFKPTKRDLELAAKYSGKEEHEIAGYVKPGKSKPAAPRPTIAEPKEAAQVAPEAEAEMELGEDPEDAEPEISPSLKKLLESNHPRLKGIKADDIPTKVEGVLKEFDQLNGMKGHVNRLLKDAGVQDLNSLKAELDGAKALHQLVVKAQQGDAQALKILKIQSQAQGNRQVADTGELPSDILDEGLYRHIAPELKSLKEENAALRRMMEERARDIDTFKSHTQKQQAIEARQSQMGQIAQEFASLVQEDPRLWDAKQGNLYEAVQAYYSQDGDVPAPLQHFHQLLEIAKEHGLTNMRVAHAVWAQQHRADELRAVRDDARKPFIGKAPTVGLSDQQGGNRSGASKGFTARELQNLGRPGFPKAPREWADSDGTFIYEKVPNYARPFLFPGEYQEE